MADLEKTIKLIFAGEDDVSRTINSVGKGLDTLSGNVMTATQPLADLTDKIIKIDTVLAAMAAGSLYLVTKQAGEFGDSFNEIATLIDAPADRLDQFRSDIINYSRDSMASLESITGATYQIISATGDWENSLKTLTAAERLNVAGKGELDATTKLLVTSLNAYGQGADAASDYSDILFTTVRVGVTNLSELSSSLGTITGLASSAGVPFDDLSAAVGALTGTVGNTSLAVTQMNGILTAVIKPSQQASETAKALGISFDQQTLAAMGLEKFLQMVYSATEGNSEIMARLFGRVEGLNGALILGADTSGKFAAALQGMEDRAGAVDIAYKKMADNFNLINQNLVNNIRATLIEVGTPLLDEWGGLVDSLGKLFDGVSIGLKDGAFDPLVEYVETISSELARNFDYIAEALPEALEGIDWSGFLDSLDDLVDVGQQVFRELFGGLDLTKPEDLEKAIQKVIDAFEKWVNLSTGIVSGLTPFLSGIGTLIDKFIELDGETVKSGGSMAGWSKAINVVSGVIPNLTAPLGLLSGSITLLSLTQIPKLITSLSGISSAIGLVTPALKAFSVVGTSLWAGWELGKMLREDIPILKAFGDSVGEAFYALFHLGDSSVEAMEKQAAHTQEIAKFAVEVARAGDAVQELPKEKTVTVESALGEFFYDIDLLTWKLNNIEDYEIEVTADISRAEEEIEVIDTWNKIITEDGIVIDVGLDSAQAVEKARETKEIIDEKLPEQKLMELELQGDIDIELQKIKSAAEVLQTAFEWDAKLKITEAQEATKQLEIIAGNINDMFAGTGDLLSDLFGLFGQNLSSSEWLILQRAIEEESRRRAELLELQKELTAKELEFLAAKTAALTSGNGLITIQADGVYPELELVLQKIIELAQVRANEEGFSALLGI